MQFLVFDFVVPMLPQEGQEIGASQTAILLPRMGSTFKQAEERISKLDTGPLKLLSLKSRKKKIVDRDQGICGKASKDQYMYYRNPKMEEGKGQRDYLKK